MVVDQSRKKPEKEFIYVPVPQMDQMGDDDEIDLLELWNVIWKGKWFVTGFTLACTLLAVYVTLYVLPVTYKSDVVLQPTGTSSQSGLSALAASRPIKLRLIEKYNLLPELYSDIWDKKNTKWIVDDSKDTPTVLMAIRDKFKGIYQVNQDKKTGLITISWIDKDPEFTKIMLNRVVNELKYYLENEYESDAKKEGIFVEDQVHKAEKELDYWERKVPSDKLTFSKIQRERFATQAVYTELRKQLALSKISEAKEIIRFKVLDQPFVPEKKFKPKRSLICALTIVVSGFLSIFLLFGKQFVFKLKDDSSSESKI